jgi:uncharacterized protein
MTVLGLVLCATLLFPPLIAEAAISYPERPGEGLFIADDADLIEADAAKEIAGIAGPLLAETGIPIIVATIDSLQSHGAAGLTIEAYAMSLFDTWGIGDPKRNRGMLLLVSQGDRRSRIELGADWGTGEHADARRIMDTLILPEFRAGNMSGGILAGVRGLEATARGLELPRRKANPWAIVLNLVLLGLIIGVIVSLFRTGRSGWGWALIAVLGIMLFFMMRSAASGGGGGSFGGGFSGGGGASGSW